ncbi:MAG: tyrosine-type recombinase/integrase [Gammaproteobacteria bacterium]|nr:tyrosine-type recombinase/integrase [Gammaproteobacteria bacterium]
MTIDKRKQQKRSSKKKGVVVGPRHPFTSSNVKRIKALLAKRGDAGMRDLALFSTAIDTMLRASDLLSLTVKDVRQRDRNMRDTVKVTTASMGSVVHCTLSKETQRILESWINSSAKKPGDYLFTPSTNVRAKPLSARQLNRLVKYWAADIRLDPRAYGTESLRRTRAAHILSETGNLEAVRLLLGHNDIGSTARYLGAIKQPDHLAISRAYEI